MRSIEGSKSQRVMVERDLVYRRGFFNGGVVSNAQCRPVTLLVGSS